MGLDPGLLGAVLGEVSSAPELERVSGRRLAEDVLYGRSDWERAIRGVRDVRSEGVSASGLSDIAGGALLGSVGFLGGVGDAASVLKWAAYGGAGASSASAALRMGRNVAGARRGRALGRLSETTVGRVGSGSGELFQGWELDEAAEMIPTDFLEQFADVARLEDLSDDDVARFTEEVARRGFSEALVLEVGENGRAVLRGSAGGTVDPGRLRLALEDLGDNYARPVSDFSSVVYRNMSVREATGLVEGVTDYRGPIYTSNSRNLARSVDPEASVMVEFDASAFTTGQVATSKPSWQAAYQAGEAEILARTADTGQMRAGIRSIQFNTAGMSKTDKAVLQRKWAQMFEKRGYVRVDSGDNVKFVRQDVFARMQGSRGDILTDPTTLIALARRLGISELPVKVVGTARKTKLGSAMAIPLARTIKAGEILRPSEVIDFDRVWETVGNARLSPDLAEELFGRIEGAEMKRILENFKRRKRMVFIKPEDLDTDEFNSMLDSIRAYLEKVQNKAGKNSVLNEDKLKEYLETVFDASAPWAKELGFETPELLSGVTRTSTSRGKVQNPGVGTTRPLFDAILRGDYEPVRRNLATQINNILRAVDEDVFFTRFYPYFNRELMLIARERGIPPDFIAALGSTLSGTQGPAAETADLASTLIAAAKHVTIGEDGVAKVLNANSDEYKALSGTIRGGIDKYVALLNADDWMATPVTGLASKTYPYAILKANPRITASSVVDRVDAIMRFAAREGEAWEFGGIEGGILEPVDLGMHQLPTKIVAELLGVPPSAVQEQTWAVWRILRDAQRQDAAGIPSAEASSFVVKGQTIRQLLNSIDIPPAHLALMRAKREKLAMEVADGGKAARWWEIGEDGFLQPRSDLEPEYMLIPEIRKDQAKVDAYLSIIYSANPIARALELDKKFDTGGSFMAIVISLTSAGFFRQMELQYEQMQPDMNQVV